MFITSRRSFGTLALLSVLMSFEEPVYGLTNLVPIASAILDGSAGFVGPNDGSNCNDEDMNTYCEVSPSSDGAIIFDMGA